jgi:hypothetical protein
VFFWCEFVSHSSCARRALQTKQFLKHFTYVYMLNENICMFDFFYIIYVRAVFMAAALIIHYSFLVQMNSE